MIETVSAPVVEFLEALLVLLEATVGAPIEIVVEAIRTAIESFERF